jgi:hypothetical protein
MAAKNPRRRKKPGFLGQWIAALAGRNAEDRHREDEFEMACAFLTGVGQL